MKKINIIAMLMACAGVSQAAVTLPDQVGDYMVLQRDTVANVWGWASPGAEIVVTGDWNNVPVKVKADKKGAWKAGLSTPTGSFTPHKVNIKGDGSDLTLSDVLIGEVWIASGQSNMEMPLAGFWSCPVRGANRAIAESGKYKGRVRVATLPLVGTPTLQDKVAGAWKESEPANAPQFTAIGYKFACTLSDMLGVPVGVIRAAYGGSKVEGWLPKEIVKDYPDIDMKDAETYDEKLHYYRPTVMYNAMLYPISNYTAKGFLWNQGESNVGKHDTYADRLSTMVKEWRRLWGDEKGEMSFYSVQLPGYEYGDGLYATSGALLREAQQKAMDMTPNCGLVTSIDLQEPGQYRQIHPALKSEIGERLAWMAAAKNYGVAGIKCDSPRLNNVEFKGDKAEVYLTGGEEGVGPWQDLKGFEVAGADRVFYPAEAVNEAVWPGTPHITLSAPEVKEIKAVRYCFRNWPEGNVTDLRGLPLLPFRSDDW